MNLFDFNPPYDPVPPVTREEYVKWDSEAVHVPGLFESGSCLYGVCLLDSDGTDPLQGHDIDEILNAF